MKEMPLRIPQTRTQSGERESKLLQILVNSTPIYQAAHFRSEAFAAVFLDSILKPKLDRRKCPFLGIPTPKTALARWDGYSSVGSS